MKGREGLGWLCECVQPKQLYAGTALLRLRFLDMVMLAGSCKGCLYYLLLESSAACASHRLNPTLINLCTSVQQPNNYSRALRLAVASPSTYPFRHFYHSSSLPFPPPPSSPHLPLPCLTLPPLPRTSSISVPFHPPLPLPPPLGPLPHTEFTLPVSSQVITLELTVAAPSPQRE